jgi:hypothetical protein
MPMSTGSELEGGALRIRLESGSYRFDADLLMDRAPKASQRFIEALPLVDRIIHVRWSGEACWIPFGTRDFGIGYENATSFPAPGDILLYPGGFSETEILISYGAVRFASKMGQLAGNHFMTITSGNDTLAEFGRKTLWEGAQPIRFYVSES